jgi:hypothetical protein
MILPILTMLLGRVFSFRLAVVRPFSPNDQEALEKSFIKWNEFVPCDLSKVPSEDSVDLFLSFSQDLSRSQASREFIRRFRTRQGTWRKCFKNIIILECKIPPGEDLYKPLEQFHNMNWVNGPNRQFERTNEAISSTRGLYEAWYLMEGDSVPVAPFFLETLMAELKRATPFGIFGSSYRGDRWDSFLTEIPTALKNHINGNAVYNHSHPLVQALVSRLSQEAFTRYNAIPYDYRFSELVHTDPEILPFQEAYIGTSRTIGNYASTNIVKEMLKGESIVHGAQIYHTREKGIGLVVSDWGIKGMLEEFHKSALSGLHPFREIVYVVPEHTLSGLKRTIERVFLSDGSSIVFRFETRNPPAFPELHHPDYIDYCYHQPVTTDLFMVSNTQMSISTPAHIMVDIQNHPVIGFLRYSTPMCDSNIFCSKVVQNSQRFANFSNTQMVHDMGMVFNKKITGVLGGHTNNFTTRTFCSQWLEQNNFKTCRPIPGPTATDYLAYLYSKNYQYVLTLTDMVQRGARDLFIHRIQPPPDERECSLDSPTTFSSYVNAYFRKKVFDTVCANIMNNESQCLSFPQCWWRPGFNKCILIVEPRPSKSRREDKILAQYKPSSFSSSSSLSESEVMGIVFGAVMLLCLSLSSLAALSALLFTKRTRTTAVPQHLFTETLYIPCESVPFVFSAPCSMPPPSRIYE